MKADDLATLRRLEQAATKGPWKACRSRPAVADDPTVATPAHVRWVRELEDGRRATSFVANCDGHGCQNDADAELIAALRNAAPALLDDAERLARVRAWAERQAKVEADLESLASAVPLIAGRQGYKLAAQDVLALLAGAEGEKE